MRTIKVKKGCLARYDDGSPFLLESGFLELKVDMPPSNTENFFVSRLGNIHITDESFIIAPKPGEFVAEIHRYLRGELIERIKVEPLIIKSIDGNITATPELTALHDEIQKLNEKITELSAKVADYLGYEI